MKSTGIVRKVDQLGRIVVPIGIRGSLNIDLKDPVEIFVDGEQILLKKYSPNMACMLTGENKDFTDGKIVLSPQKY